MSKPLWTFAGYVSEAGGRVIQEWYDQLPEEEHDELQDMLNYLAVTLEWKRPHFDKVRPPLHEIRSKASLAKHVLRVYGFFNTDVRRQFVLLSGNEAKKTGYDEKGQRLALHRWGLLRQGKASIHEFNI